jgi:hypothetical protein
MTLPVVYVSVSVSNYLDFKEIFSKYGILVEKSDTDKKILLENENTLGVIEEKINSTSLESTLLEVVDWVILDIYLYTKGKRHGIMYKVNGYIDQSKTGNIEEMFVPTETKGVREEIVSKYMINDLIDKGFVSIPCKL